MRTSEVVAGLFKLHHASVYRRARRMLGSHEDAQDAAQEVFARALSAEALPAQQAAAAWLRRAVINRCLNQRRDRSAERRAAAVAGEGVESSGGDEATARAEVRELLGRASAQEAAAAVAVWGCGELQDEAAQALGVSRRTVGNLLERVRRKAGGGA